MLIIPTIQRMHIFRNVLRHDKREKQPCRKNLSISFSLSFCLSSLEQNLGKFKQHGPKYRFCILPDNLLKCMKETTCSSKQH